jgi:polar amino acid transport system substrate-binding protein
MSKLLRLGLGLATLALVLVLAATATGSTDAVEQVRGCAKSDLPLKAPGTLTLATDDAARWPWWGGAAKAPWKAANPYAGKGFESALAYAIAKRLGFSGRQVAWQAVPTGQAYSPGAKSFDFYLGQVAYSPARDRDVDFSSGYYVIPQALVSRNVYSVAGAKTREGVRFTYMGVQFGTPSHRYVVRHIRPHVGPMIYDSYETALPALERGVQIHGIVVDLPTAYKFRTRVADGIIIGQFPNKGSRDRYALVFEKGSTLRYCVNKALAQLHANGTVKKLQTRWLTSAGGARVLR